LPPLAIPASTQLKKQKLYNFLLERAAMQEASVSQGESGSWRELFVRGYAAPLITLSLGVGLHAFNGFLVSTSLPTAVLAIGGAELMSWSFTVYLVFAIVGGSAAARLKHRLGARRALVWPAAVFLAGTLCAGLAPTMPVFLFGRALQGAGEGVISALCYALIPVLFPSRLVARVFGVEAMVWALAAFGGPLVSGVLTETVSWRAAFFVNLPLIALFVVLVLTVVPAEARGKDLGPFPAFRLFGCGAGIMLVAVAAILHAPALMAACLLGAAAVLVGVFIVDRRQADRLFPSDAFSLTTTVGAGLWMVLLMPVAQASTSVYLNITIQHLWGYGPTVAGYISAAMALSWSGSALVAANIDSLRIRQRLIRLGPVLVVMGLVGILLAILGDTPAAVIPCQIAIGSGFGMSWAFISQGVMEAARPGERDRASAMLPTVQSGGYALGAAIAGLVANSAGLIAGLGTGGIAVPAAWTFGIAAGLGTLAVLASLGVRIVPRPPVSPGR
jgi:MFS family permease